jgi:CheY-like chemotaxis protein
MRSLEGGNARTARLLAVDDDADAADLIARVAERAGLQSRSLTDPRQVRQIVRDWMPDIISLDLCMPGLDGIEMLSVLQRIGFTGHLIIISGQDPSMSKVARYLGEARGLKVAGCLAKPIETASLRDLLARLVPAISA